MQPNGDVALITGASSGIGVEFARVLAARGVDLIVTARRVDRLEQLRRELESGHGVRVAVIGQDLADPDAVERLVVGVQELGLDVSILVNNAGLGYYGPVVEQDPDDVHAMLQVNVLALTRLTRMFAAQMQRRGRGYILNCSSFAALQPIPRYTIYSGAKAYVVAFSQALRHELKKTGIKVSVVCPGFTTTEFHDVARHKRTRLMRLTSLDAAHVAWAGIDGMFRGKILIVPGLWYKLNALVTRVLPRGMASALSAQMVKN